MGRYPMSRGMSLRSCLRSSSDVVQCVFGSNVLRMASLSVRVSSLGPLWTGCLVVCHDASMFCPASSQAGISGSSSPFTSYFNSELCRHKLDVRFIHSRWLTRTSGPAPTGWRILIGGLGIVAYYTAAPRSLWSSASARYHRMSHGGLTYPRVDRDEEEESIPRHRFQNDRTCIKLALKPHELFSRPPASLSVTLQAGQGRSSTHWQVLRNPFTISEIFSNRCRSNALAPPSSSRSSSSEACESRGEPDLAMTRNVSASNRTASTPRQRFRRNVRWEVMRLILGMRVWMTDDHAWAYSVLA